MLAGKYRVERLIGSGGTGVVAQATHLKLERQVALKLLRSEVSDRPEIVARFAREARAAARLKGEHVTRILDVGELDDKTPYLVMEFLEGSDFRALLAEGGRLGITDAVGYVLQACEAVAEAHAAGIVHRDLKPANLFLTHTPDSAPLVKVLDFGISKAVTGVEAEEAVSLTSSASVMGTPLYMSPEQMKNAREVDARTDLWPWAQSCTSSWRVVRRSWRAVYPSSASCSCSRIQWRSASYVPRSPRSSRESSNVAFARTAPTAIAMWRNSRKPGSPRFAGRAAPGGTHRTPVGESPSRRRTDDVDARAVRASDTGGGSAALTPPSADRLAPPTGERPGTGAGSGAPRWW